MRYNYTKVISSLTLLLFSLPALGQWDFNKTQNWIKQQQVDSVSRALENLIEDDLTLKEKNEVQEVSADLFGLKGEYERQITIYTSLLEKNSLEIDEESRILTKIGDAYYSLRDSQQSLLYFEQVLALSKKHNLNDQGLAYYNLSKAMFLSVGESLDTTFRVARLYEIIANLELALEGFEKTSNRTSLANSYYFKGITHKSLYEMQSSILDSISSNLEKAAGLYREIGNIELSTNLQIESSDFDRINKNYQKAISDLSTILSSNRATKKQQVRIYAILFQCYEAIEDWKNAYYYSLAHNDSLNFNEVFDRSLKSQVITENYLIDKEVDKLESNIKSLGIALGVLAVILLISYLIFLQTIQRKKLENLQALIRGEEQERQRLAADLHDGIGVLLTSIKMRLSSFEEKVDDQKAYYQSLDQIDEACVEVRRVSHNLSPASLNKLGLEEAVLDLLDQVQRNSIKTEADVSFNEESIAKENEILIYRIIQELINNSLKYAEPSQLNLSLKAEGDQLNLSYSDQGNGFDKQKVKAGLGLKSIASRVDIMKGKFSYQSILGQGSQFDISIPLNG